MSVAPGTLHINAWTGDGAPSSPVSVHPQIWAFGTKPLDVRTYLRPPVPADQANWRDSRVGWGLILPERKELTETQLATADDAPEPIRTLVKERGNAPVFRYRSGSPNEYCLLRNYAYGQDITVDPRTPAGVGPGTLPYYMLIFGTPAEIPWRFQYVLNATLCVGRLDLEGSALDHYVQALLDDWKGAGSQVNSPLVWAVDHNAGDITHLMRNAVAAPLAASFRADSDLAEKTTFLDGVAAPATCGALITALSENKPAVVVSTSHGQTGPLGQPELMKAYLGLPVGQDLQHLDLSKLLAAWDPDGAIWYAHACCSAGSDSTMLFDGLVEVGSSVDQVLKGVATLGALTAPLPRALLGAPKPLRAFVGHVEPTFDWTLQQPATGQFLTETLRRALYNNLYAPKPLGLALRDYYAPLGALYAQYDQAFNAYNQGAGDALRAALYAKLVARDLQSTVILGDPTALLPALP